MSLSLSMQKVSVTLGDTAALKNVNVDVHAGKIIGLLGPSGAGMTTLMRVIVGRQRIHSGKIEVLGQPAGSVGLRRRIGYMPQSAAVHYDLTVRENILYFASMLGIGKRDVMNAIVEVDLKPQLHQIALSLSGGQKSRLSLAIALLGRPELLVLDEPTVGVDPLLRKKLWRIFRMSAERGTTLVVSSHVMDEAGRCDDLLLIRRGRLLAHGTAEDLLRRTGTTNIEDSFVELVGKG